jgi:RNA recognition motif-containing protein
MNNEDRVLSTTAVFVANLPFTVKDEDLKAYFKEFNPQSAHVVVTRNGRSRGYGFVDFNNEKDQQNSITAKNKQKFEEREITVTPSYKTQEIAPEMK